MSVMTIENGGVAYLKKITLSTGLESTSPLVVYKSELQEDRHVS